MGLFRRKSAWPKKRPKRKTSVHCWLILEGTFNVDYFFSLEQLKSLVAKLSGDVVLGILLPDEDMNVERDKKREWVVGESRVRQYHAEFAREPLFAPFLLDSTKLNAQELVTRVASMVPQSSTYLLSLLREER